MNIFDMGESLSKNWVRLLLSDAKMHAYANRNDSLTY